MEQWKEYRLGEVVYILDNNRVPLSSKIRSNRKGFYPYYGAQGIIDYIDDYIFDGTYLLVAEDGENLKSHKQPIAQIAKGKYWVNNHAHILESNGICDIRYICYLLNTIDISGYVTGSAQPKLNQENLKAIRIKLPSLTTQIKIADLVSKFDDKIELNRKINSNLEEQAKALYDNYASQVNREARIGDLANEVLDYSHCEFSRVYLLNSSDVTEGTFPKLGLVDNKNLKGHFKKRFRFGDILYSQIRPRNHHYGLVMFNPDRYISSTRLMVIRANKELVSQYLLYQSIISPCVCDEFTLKTETRSGTFPQGNYKDMANIIIPYGTKEQRELIEPKLKSIRETIYSNQKENIILSSLRDSLLPRLMSGEIEV